MPMRCFAAIDRQGTAFDGVRRISGGTFRMGSDKPLPEEAPDHRVTVDELLIDRTPETSRPFKEFVRATGHTTFAEIRPDSPCCIPQNSRGGCEEGSFDPCQPQIRNPAIFRKAPRICERLA